MSNEAVQFSLMETDCEYIYQEFTDKLPKLKMKGNAKNSKSKVYSGCFVIKFYFSFTQKLLGLDYSPWVM